MISIGRLFEFEQFIGPLKKLIVNQQDNTNLKPKILQNINSTLITKTPVSINTPSHMLGARG